MCTSLSILLFAAGVLIEEMIMGLLSIHIDVYPKADMRDIYSIQETDFVICLLS